MTATSIEWTRNDDGTPGKTWNPVRGCSLVSPGCERCYAQRLAHRFSAPGRPYAGLTVLTDHHGPRWSGVVRTVPEMLAEPLRWRAPARVFVNSMSDLFHEDVPDEYIAATFGVMAACPQHTFQILTKRAERMARWFEWIDQRPARSSPVLDVWDFAAAHLDDGRLFIPSTTPWPLPNVHIGVSVEDRKHGLPRIDELRKVPAAVRMLSIEPLLEDLGTIDFDGIHWVIAGAESGHGARPMHDDWVRSVRDQCVAAGVPFFYKQRLDERGRKVSLPMLDGRQWAEMPHAR